MKHTANQIIGEVVAADYRTAAVFQKYHIDFCCQGNRSIEDACTQKSIDPQEILRALDDLRTQTAGSTPEYRSWPLDLLADHIQAKHHTYVEKVSGQLNAYIDTICRVHGEHHPELLEIRKEFTAGAGELAAHMKKEEFLLFPYIKKMVKTGKAGTPHVRSVQQPIAMMMEEHDTEGKRFGKISLLTNQYTPPADACNTYRATYALLKEFEEDLHLHIHLENNILFPKSLELEKQLSH